MPRKPKLRTKGTWNKEQALAARAKSLETRRRKAIQRKAVAQEAASLLKAICASDPITDVEKALSYAAKHGRAKSCEHLSLALARLKSQPKSIPSASNTTTACSPARQPTQSTPQSAQYVEPKPSAAALNYAQYTEPLVQQGKESLNPGGVVALVGVGAGQGAGGGGVIASNTRGSNSGSSESSGSDASFAASGAVGASRSKLLQEATVEELEARLAQLRGKPPVKTDSVKPYGLVGPVPSSGPGSIGPAPQEGMEKFLVGGVWVWGKRRK